MGNKVDEIIYLLNQILEDKTVPRNIRNAVKEAVEELGKKEKDLNLRKDKVIQILDEISNDPNMPIYTRTQIWNVIGMLESL